MTEGTLFVLTIIIAVDAIIMVFIGYRNCYIPDDQLEKAEMIVKKELDLQEMRDDYTDRRFYKELDKQKAVEDAKKTLSDESAGKDAYEQAAKDLNDRIMPIGAKMYQQTSTDDTTKSDDAKSDSKSDDEPVEGEVVDK